jgi:hypothetical protein
MRFIYYNAEWELIEVHPEQRTNSGVLLGSISDHNFREVNIRFLAQSLCNLKNLEPKGLQFQIFEGPSMEIDPDVIEQPGAAPKPSS